MKVLKYILCLSLFTLVGCNIAMNNHSHEVMVYDTKFGVTPGQSIISTDIPSDPVNSNNSQPGRYNNHNFGGSNSDVVNLPGGGSTSNPNMPTSSPPSDGSPTVTQNPNAIPSTSDRILRYEINYREVNRDKLLKFFQGRSQGSVFGQYDGYFLDEIIRACKDCGMNPIFMLAITGAEQSYVPVEWSWYVNDTDYNLQDLINRLARWRDIVKAGTITKLPPELLAEVKGSGNLPNSYVAYAIVCNPFNYRHSWWEFSDNTYGSTYGAINTAVRFLVPYGTTAIIFNQSVNGGTAGFNETGLEDSGPNSYWKIKSMIDYINHAARISSTETYRPGGYQGYAEDWNWGKNVTICFRQLERNAGYK